MTEDGPEPGPVLNLRGRSVALGPLERRLVPTYQRWENDFSLHPLRGIRSRPVTLEQASQSYERTDPDSAWFTVYELATQRPIGLAWWDQIEPWDGTAVLGIFLGESEVRGRGYGTEAVQLMLDYAFNTLGLHNAMLIVAEFNHAARRAYQKAGFREYGRRSGSYRVGGRRWDDIYMQALAPDFPTSISVGQQDLS
ncbi:MAG: GNAT family N-acetyltransferase [Chloroflexota bacterium]|nr:GNAT family N-acetyltransferase [Chloroflexota bacterium]